MGTVNKSELARLVAGKLDFSLTRGTDVVDAMVEAMKDCLAEGNDVSLVGFGTLKVRKREAREGRNPQTGATIQIPASKVVKFKQGKGLKDSINDGK